MGSKITKDVLAIFKEYMHPCICGIPIATETIWYTCVQFIQNHRDTLMYEKWTKKYMHYIISIIYGQFTATEI